MAVAMAGCKRMCPLEEELMLLDPHHFKRARLDGTLQGPEDLCSPRTSCSLEAASPYAAGGWLSAGSGQRRPHQDMDEDSEADGEVQLPAEKRLRQMLAAAAGSGDFGGGPSASSLGGAVGAAADGGAAGEPQVHEWAKTIVLALHGSPSVEEAVRRCSEVLGDFGAEVRQAAVREMEATAGRHAQGADDGRPQDSVQGLQHSNSVLWRAVRHLTSRCRRLEAESPAAREEIAQLRQALEQSQEAQRRMAHSNEVLQGHLRVHLDACRDGLGVH